MFTNPASRAGRGRVNAFQAPAPYPLTIVSRAANQSIPNNTWTNVAFDTLVKDDVGAVPTLGANLVAPKNFNWMRFTVGLQWDNFTSQYRGGRVDVAGSTYDIHVYPSFAESNQRFAGRWWPIAAGNINLLVYQNRGAATNLSGSSFGGASYLQVEWAI